MSAQGRVWKDDAAPSQTRLLRPDLVSQWASASQGENAQAISYCKIIGGHMMSTGKFMHLAENLHRLVSLARRSVNMCAIGVISFH